MEKTYEQSHYWLCEGSEEGGFLLVPFDKLDTEAHICGLTGYERARLVFGTFSSSEGRVDVPVQLREVQSSDWISIEDGCNILLTSENVPVQVSLYGGAAGGRGFRVLFPKDPNFESWVEKILESAIGECP